MKKLNAFTDPDCDRYFGRQDDSISVFHRHSRHYVPAVLIISDTQEPPKVWTEHEVKAIVGPLTMLARCLSQPYYFDRVEYLDAEDVQEAYDELKGIAMRMGLVTF